MEITTYNIGDKETNEYNMKLLQARAQACVDYLAGKGIILSRLEAKGKGEAEPAARTKKPDGKDDPEGRKKNWRVTYQIIHF